MNDIKQLFEDIENFEREEKISCEWSQDCEDDLDMGAWNTSCGGTFCVCEGDPAENNMWFCCYCGLRLIQKPFIYKDEEEE